MLWVCNEKDCTDDFTIKDNILCPCIAWVAASGHNAEVGCSHFRTNLLKLLHPDGICVVSVLIRNDNHIFWRFDAGQLWKTWVIAAYTRNCDDYCFEKPIG